MNISSCSPAPLETSTVTHGPWRFHLHPSLLFCNWYLIAALKKKPHNWKDVFEKFTSMICLLAGVNFWKSWSPTDLISLKTDGNSIYYQTDAKQTVLFCNPVDVHQSKGLSHQFFSNRIFILVCQISHKVWNITCTLKKFISTMTSVDLDKILSGRIWVLLISQWCYKLLNRHFMHIWQLWF